MSMCMYQHTKLTSNVYTHLKLEDAQREMERLERIEKEMKKCAKQGNKGHREKVLMSTNRVCT